MLHLQTKLEEEARVQEETRLNDIICKKQADKKLKTITTKYMKRALGKISIGVQNVASLKIIDEIKGHRRESNERESVAPALLWYDMLKRTRKGTSAIPHNPIITNYRNKLRQMFSGSSWFDRKCEKAMFRYLLWPDEITLLHR